MLVFNSFTLFSMGQVRETALERQFLKLDSNLSAATHCQKNNLKIAQNCT